MSFDKTLDYTLCLDTSGSTNECLGYWVTVNKIYKEFNITKIISWASEAQIIDLNELINLIDTKIGNGGTNISNLALLLIKEKIKENIILITDGKISLSNVNKTDYVFDINNYKLNNVISYILYDYKYDYSVVAPFRRNNINYIFKKDITNEKYELILDQYVSNDLIKLINNIDKITLDTFNDKYLEIENTIIAQTMGKGNEIIKIKLFEFKKSLISELSKKLSCEHDSILVSLEENKDTIFDSISYYPWAEVIKIHNTYYYSNNSILGCELETKINKLISYCENRHILNVTELKNSYRFNNAKNSEPINIQELDDVEDIDTICPISLDNDNMVIMIYEGLSIFSSLDKNEIDFITNNPLNILNMPILIEKIKNRIGHAIGLKTLKEMDNKIIKFNPFNRKEIIGCITFENNMNNIKYSNHIIRLLFSDGKIIGNITFYYAVLYFIIQDIEFIDTNVKKIITNNLIYRLKNTKTFMSCCGLSNYITTKVSVASSLFYIVNSGLLNLKKSENILRYHLTCITHMIKLLNILNFPINKDALQHIDYQIALLELLHMCKKNKSFNNIIKGLYKNTIKISNDNYVLIDGTPSEKQINEILDILPSSCKKLSINEIITLANMVHPNLSFGNIILDIKLDILTKINKDNKNIWNYILSDDFEPIKICMTTGRPFYYIDDNKWIDVNQNKVGILLKNQFNAYKYVLQYMIKYKNFPTKNEYIIFCSKKHNTLPQQIEYFYDIIFKSYEEFNNYYETSNLELLYGSNNNFKDIKYNIIKNSISIKDRILLEKQDLHIFIKNFLS